MAEWYIRSLPLSQGYGFESHAWKIKKSFNFPKKLVPGLWVLRATWGLRENFENRKFPRKTALGLAQSLGLAI